LRRADRLFQVIQILRRARRPVTATAIAEEVETSLRTIYRDIAQLIADRVPIRGEAGVGYILEGGFDMPPLMLTPDEIEAVMLGAQWVRQRADPALARAAADLVAKIAAVVPEHLRPLLIEPASTSHTTRKNEPDAIDMARVRTAIRAQGKLHIAYRDEAGRETRRTVWPIAISYWDTARIIVGWCELRNAFRHFRTDRIVDAQFLEVRYTMPRPRLRAAWRRELSEPLNDAQQKRADARLGALIE